MEEGVVLRWHVKEGDSVQQGQVLLEIETDKATLEVESESSGIVAKLVVAEGQAALVKQPIAWLNGVPAEAGPSPAPAASPTQRGADAPSAVPSAAASSPADGNGGKVKASPAARKAAAVLGVSLADCGPGSGPAGRILREDVERAAAAAPPAQAASPAPAGPAFVPAPAARPMAGGQRSPLSRMRRAIARNLQASKQTVPHFYVKATVDAGPLLACHARNKALFPCSLNDVILEAVAKTVAEFPAFRSQLDGDDLVVFDGAHLGMAVAVADGLVVPVLKDADRLSLKGIADASRRLAADAREGRVTAMGEGVFSVSNLGMYGTEEFSAIINPPESGILAVGAVREDVVVREGAIRAGKVVTLVLSADHRVVDGAVAAQFMRRLKELLEALS